MDGNLLLLSFIFGLIGMGMLGYGKKAGRTVPLGIGAALIIVPYFISNLILLLIVGCGLTITPWFFRNA